MIHLVHFSSSPGGIELQIPQLVKKMGNDVVISSFVIRPPGKSSFNIYTDTGIPVKYGSKFNLAAICKLWIYAIGRRRDIFHVFNLGPYFLLVLRLAGVRKVVYSIRGTKYWRGPINKVIVKQVWRLAFTKRQVFIANSFFSKSTFAKGTGYDKNNIRVVYNPVASGRLKGTCIRTNPQSLNIIYVGRLVRGKNLFKWLDIAGAIRLKFPAARFYLYGDGPLRKELQAHGNELGISDFVQFAGFKDNIGDVYCNADLLLFLSEYESFGNVTVESILCGIPVIAAGIPAMKEIFSDYPEFILENDSGIEMNVVKKLENLDALRALARKAGKEFALRYSLNSHVNALKEIYHSLNEKNN